MKYDYDLIVIGGGTAGLIASKIAKGIGKKVALIEENEIGGVCTWTGCVPSKAIIHVANLLHESKKLKNFGISIQENIDSEKVMEYVRKKVNEVYQRETSEELEKRHGIKLYKGQGKFIDSHTVCVNQKNITAFKIIIAGGSEAFVPPIEGIDKVDYLTNESIFNLKELPKSIAIIGGGAIGIELSSALNRLGVQVTVIERNERLMHRVDAELIGILMNQFESEGIDIKVSTEVKRLYKKDDQVIIECADKDNNIKTIQADKVLVAVGRKPSTEKLNLENAGIEYTRRGIIVNSKLQTSVGNIYAAGDIVGPYQFTHMADYQAAIAARNACIPFFKKHVDYKNVIWVIFSDPELASIGLGEKEAKEKHSDIKVYRQSYDVIDRAVTDDKKTGLAKFILDKNYKILGAQILGERAGELIHEIQLGKYFDIRFSNFYKPIHAYPTYSDLIWKVAKKAYVDSIQNNFLVKLIKKIF